MPAALLSLHALSSYHPGDNHDKWSPPDAAGLQECRFNLYRISSDIAPQFMSTMFNLQYQTLYQDVDQPLSRQGMLARHNDSLGALRCPPALTKMCLYL